MVSKLESNPFMKLFPDNKTAFSRALEARNESDKNTTESDDFHNDIVTANTVLEIVFRFTLDPERQVPQRTGLTQPTALLSLHREGDSFGSEVRVLRLERLGELIGERLFGPTPSEDFLIFSGSLDEADFEAALQQKGLTYLCECFVRLGILERLPALLRISKLLREHIVTYGVSLFAEPALLNTDNPEEEINAQLVNFVANEAYLHDGHVRMFLRDLCEKLKNNLAWMLGHGFGFWLKAIGTRVLPKQPSLFAIENELSFGVFIELAQIPALAQAIMLYTGSPTDSGESYQKGLLGRLIAASHIPQLEIGPFDFFDRPGGITQQEVSHQNRNAWSLTKQHWSRLDMFFEAIFKHTASDPNVKSAFFNWFGLCLECNKDRAKSHSAGNPLEMASVMGHGMALGLSWVLLGLCKPILNASQGSPSKAVLRINPFYGSDSQPGATYLRNVHEETKLVSHSESEAPKDNTYSSLTELFYLTHKSMQLSYVALCERCLHLNEELHHLQDTWRFIEGRGAQSSQLGDQVRESLQRRSSLFFTYTAALTNPDFLERALRFLSASAEYLSQLAMFGWNRDSWQRIESLEESAEATEILAHVPEFVATNVVEFALHVSRTSEETLETSGVPLDSLISFVIIFMGSPTRMRNPHLRAKLASVLEVLMPFRDSLSDLRANSSLTAFFHRQEVFSRHPLVNHLVEALLNVFVTIEMTGEGVEFEEKFRYRRPMYAAMRYMDTEERYAAQYKALESHALEHMEDTKPPLLLRFVNLLINDAIFLLDEALDYLKQLKHKERERGPTGEWPGLAEGQDASPSAQEERRSTEEASFRHMSSLAQFHCLLGANTISRLHKLSEQAPSLLTHQLLVDRIAAMLNYFLLRLAGPRRRDLVVEDKERYSFRPAELLASICGILSNLAGRQDEAGARFRRAVVRDQRSFSPAACAFAAGRVLPRVCSGTAVAQFEAVLATLRDEVALEAAHEAEEVALEEEAPEEFLDPIMGSLMTDPVRLPSSGQVVDRSTIARHILSDQTDPFNRSALSMAMVQPEEALKARIEAWVREKSGAQIE